MKNNMDFIKGLGVGVIAGATVGMAVAPKKKTTTTKTLAGRALKAAGEIVENVSGALGM